MTDTKHTQRWKLIWHGNEKYPYPLSITTADGERWVARDGTVSCKEYAFLIAAAPDMADELTRLRAQNAALVYALQDIADGLGETDQRAIGQFAPAVARAALAQAESDQ